MTLGTFSQASAWIQIMSSQSKSRMGLAKCKAPEAEQPSPAKRAHQPA